MYSAVFFPAFAVHRFNVEPPLPLHQCDRFELRLVTHGELHSPPPFDLLPLGSVRVILDDERLLVRPQDEPALALVFGTPNAAPVVAAILAEQKVIYNNQRMPSLTVDIVQALNETKEKRVIYQCIAGNRVLSKNANISRDKRNICDLRIIYHIFIDLMPWRQTK